MAQKYYNVKETAQVLGISENDVKKMHADRKLHGYRDGADWKFKVEEIDELAQQRSAEESATPDEDEGDVLLSEVELGESDPGASGTVIGMEEGGQAPADSDIRLGDDVEPAAAGEDGVSSKVSEFEDLDLTLEDGLTLEEPGDASTSQTPAGSSDIGLAGDEMEDDDLVLGGSGAGSDITIGGDSGISLVDPTDSGLSLDEEPLELAGSGTESLELGEDDMIALSEDGDADAPTELKTDDPFLLTPDESGDDDSESGSQVIALDPEAEGDEAATMIASGPAAGSMAAMLEEDLGAEPTEDLGMGGPMGADLGAGPMPGQPGQLAQGAPVTQPGAAALPEAPYSIYNILALVLCAVILIFCGMFMTDLMWNNRNMDSVTSFNSPMIEWILSWFEK